MTDVVKAAETVTLTIDGVEVTAPKGALLIRVAEQMGIEIPRFCDHPLLAPAGACRQCLVEVEGQRKPVASCTQTVADGMVVKTQLTSPVAKKAQAGIMELLLVNHPLDCPMCDKGGECPLQNQAMSTGRSDTRFHEHKREYPKPIAISTQVLLDRERCVLCQRCTRFSEEIAGDKFIDLMDRSSAEQIGVYRDEAFGRTEHPHSTIDEPRYEQEVPEPGDVPFNSYFSGNTVQICPVGALTGAQYRFRARPFDLVSSPSVCEHCAAGCAQRTDHRRGKVMRRLAGDDPAVNEEWNCDKGRWGFRYATAFDRITKPMLRGEDGDLHEASWSEALEAAAEGLRNAREGRGVGVLTGGRLTVEDAYAYAKFARVALRTNDIDFRARPISAEETEFLAASVVGATDATYADIEAAPAVVIVGLEPEEECPILFLRLRKAHTKDTLAVTAVAPFLSRGFTKLGARLVEAVPGAEAGLLAGDSNIAEALRAPGAVLIVGERLATVPGGLSAAARAELASVWDLEAGIIPSRPGRDTDQMIADAAEGRLGALVVAGVDPADLADPRLAERALDNVGFLVSLEVRRSAVSRRADVVFPVAPVVEKAGSFVDWEGRLRTFERVLTTPAMTDARVLDAIAAQLGVALGTGDTNAVRRELGGLPATGADRAVVPQVPAAEPARPADGEAVLATWHHLIDLGSLLDGDEYLGGTARVPVVRLGKALAERIGVAEDDPVTVGTERGALTLPAAITELPDGVVWLPTNSPGATVRRTLGVTAGAVVKVSRGSSGSAASPPGSAAGKAGPLLASGGSR